MFEKVALFGNNFLGSLRDKPGSMSLKKLMAIGVFWVYAVTSIRFTDKSNLASTLIIHSSLITALIITHAVSKSKTNPNDPPPADNTQQG